MGDVEHGEACVVFAFARAGSGVPVMTSSVGAGVGDVPVELPVITGNDASTSVGGLWSGAGTTSSAPTLGIWIMLSVPLLQCALRLQ